MIILLYSCLGRWRIWLLRPHPPQWRWSAHMCNWRPETHTDYKNTIHTTISFHHQTDELLAQRLKISWEYTPSIIGGSISRSHCFMCAYIRNWWSRTHNFLFVLYLTIFNFSRGCFREEKKTSPCTRQPDHINMIGACWSGERRMIFLYIDAFVLILVHQVIGDQCQRGSGGVIKKDRKAAWVDKAV